MAGRCRRATEEYRRGFRFVWPSTRAGRRPHQPVANDRLGHRRIGDARVSKADGSQSLDLPRDARQAAGVDAGYVYHAVASGVRDDRQGLDSCVRALRTGDVLVVWNLDRLGRTLAHLVNTVQDLSARGVGLRVRTGHGAQIDTTTAGRLGGRRFALSKAQVRRPQGQLREQGEKVLAP